MSIDDNYYKAHITPSDINEHLPMLLYYAKKCEHITEMGVRGVVSTWAFLKANPKKLVCYDLEKSDNIDTALHLANDAGIEMKFHEADVLEVDIEQTDLLFIDTFHTGTQLRKELELHAKKVNKYIAFHDTFTFWEDGEPTYGDASYTLDKGNGLKHAILDFLLKNKEWSIVYGTSANNGLLIISK